MTRLVNACWRLFKVAVAVALLGAVATGVYMYVRMDEEIRRQIETMLAERYPHLQARVGGARVIEGRGIEVYDLSLTDPAADPGGDALLKVDVLLLVCDAELTKLVCGAPAVERVEVKRPQLAVRRLRGGGWNVASLAPTTPCGIAPPQVIIHDGVVAVSDDASDTAPPLVLRDIQLTMTPAGAAEATPATSSTATWPTMRVDGVLGGPQVKRVELHGTFAGPQAPGDATIVVDELQVGSALLAWARPHLPPVVQGTRVEARLDGKITLAWANCSTPPAVQADFAMSGGRIEDALLPGPVTELAGRIAVQGGLLQIENVHGKCGPAAVGASINRNGWAARAPVAMSLWATNATLDAALYQSMRRFEAAGFRVAGVLCDEWDKFQPTGVVDATLQVEFDGHSWRPAAGLRGRQLSFESDRFRYRLSDGSGTINYTPRTTTAPPLVDLDVTAYGGGQPLHITGQVFDPKAGAAGWAQITGENVEVDEAMIAANPNDTCRAVIRELNPSGRFHVTWRIDRAQPGGEAVTSLRLDLADMRIVYDRFKYPLRGIRGSIIANGNDWTFSELQSGGRRPVHGSGTLRPIAGGHELALRLSGEGASLDVELYDALPESVQRAWTELNPRGEIDFVADVNYRTGQPRASIGVAIRPKPESTQLKPTFFPYLMEAVSGTITYRDGQISLADMRAEHDRTVIRTNGNGAFWPEGHWQFRLTGLTADNVEPRQDLISALPPRLRTLVDRLRPTGSFSLHDGVLGFRKKSASEIEPLEAEWDVAIDCHQTDLACGIDLKNVHGTVRLAGSSDGVKSTSAGELDLESVTFLDIQYTNVRGPMWVNESKCLFGRWATDAQQQAARPLSGMVYDGAVNGSAWVMFDALPQYQAEINVVGADLRRMVVERFGGGRDFTGKVDANMVLSGRGSYLESLLGEGDVHIRDANLYELSLLASLLKMLRTGAADKTAFTRGDVAYRIEGRKILLDEVNFLGDIVNLYGKGETNFDQQLTLAFSAVMAGHDERLPFVRKLVRQTNEQIMQMYVTGSLSDPHVTTEAFPGIAQMVHQLGTDLSDPWGAAERRQEERRRLAAQQQQQQR